MNAVAVLLLLAAPAAQSDDAAFYRESVLPILERSCFECHGAEGRPKGGLRLTSRDDFLAGGDSGPVLEEGGAWDASVLLEAIGYEDEFLQMPPDGKLPAADLAVLREWIERRAPYDAAVAVEGVEPEPEERHTKGDGREGWAYRQLAPPPVPAVAGVTHPVDAFLRARLDAAGLLPNPLADDRVLVRRVTYDLTGLPPTPEEVEAYVDDPHPDRWERLVERLLASPHYGERWGRHWLDVVRYAETNGFERDSDKPNIWRYRDWVIDAFNRDLPYDRFVLEQLAGDELPDRDRGSIVASGYLRLQQWDDEPGEGRLQGRYDTLDDIVSTTSQAFLGSTLGCARCHDHKADPFDAVDYYRFMAFFHGLTDMSVEGTQADVASPEEQAVQEEREAAKRRELEALGRDRRALLEEFLGALRDADAAVIGGAGPVEGGTYRFYRDTWAALPDFEMHRPEDSGALERGYLDLTPRTRDEAIGFVFEGALRVPRDGEYELRLVADDGARVELGGEPVLEVDGLGAEPRRREAQRTLAAGTAPLRVEWFNAEGAPTLHLDWRRVDDARWRWTHAVDDVPEGWTQPGFDDSSWAVGEAGFGARGTPGTEVRTDWTAGDEVRLRRTFEWDADRGEEPRVVFHHDDDVQVWINGVLAFERTGYITEYEAGELNEAGRAALVDGTNTIAVRCIQDFGGRYVHVRVVPASDLRDGRRLVDVAFGRRTITAPAAATGDLDLERLVSERADELLGEGGAERLAALDAEIERVRRRRVPRVTAFAARERGGEVPPLHVHVRGSAHSLGERVEPGVPPFVEAGALPAIEPAAGGASSGRRTALAQWIASPENPLTPRVMVNRIWQHHFGVGLVATANDFGELGERPTHPGLLDWLASQFVDGCWSVKDMHRLLLTSDAYRRSSIGRPDALEVDAANTLLWRVPARRLSAEEVRDSMLAVADLLELEMGGPSVYSRMPAAALATSSRPDAVWGTSPPEQQNRRTIYVKVKRSLLTPLLVAHDMADVDATCPARFTTILPTQALQMLNGSFSGEVAAALADRLEAEVPAGASGSSGGMLAGRVRRGLELALSRPAAADEVADYVEFLDDLIAAAPPDEPLTERRALELFCLTVINLNEFVFVD